MSQRSCGTCRWFDPSNYGSLDASFFDPEDDVAACLWPAERLPYSLRYGNRERLGVMYSDGADCNAWEPSPE